MIVLDTNVLSEPLRSRPDGAVLDWLDGISHTVVLTAISVGELLVGVSRLPAGHRRDGLMKAVDGTLAMYGESVLPYDAAAARVYAVLQESRRASGHPLSVEDGMIAAICRSRRLPLATRNVRDFQDLGIDVINPWTDRPQ